VLEVQHPALLQYNPSSWPGEAARPTREPEALGVNTQVNRHVSIAYLHRHVERPAAQLRDCTLQGSTRPRHCHVHVLQEVPDDTDLWQLQQLRAQGLKLMGVMAGEETPAAHAVGATEWLHWRRDPNKHCALGNQDAALVFSAISTPCIQICGFNKHGCSGTVVAHALLICRCSLYRLANKLP
jgi:hypothetical protein